MYRIHHGIVRRMVTAAFPALFFVSAFAVDAANAELTWADALRILEDAGLGASEAALCGATSEGWDDALAALAAEPESLGLVETRGGLFAAAAHQRRQLLDELAVGRGVEDAETALPAAEGERQACRADLASALEAVRTEYLGAVLDQFGVNAATLLERVVENRARRVPPAWRVLDLSASEWMTLEMAVRKDEREIALSTAEASALTAARSSPAVLAAEVRLELNLPALDEMFMNARRAELP